MEIRIVFMGSPQFAVPTLQALAIHFDVIGVVTQPDRPSGRGRTVTPPDIKVVAESLNLPVIQPPHLRDEQTFQRLRHWQPDVIVVAAFGQILKPDVLNLPPFGCINVHASLLPRWRGAAPIQATILYGDQQTGVTIMKMDAGVDTGPILSQRKIPILPEDTAASLSSKLAHFGAELLIETLPGYVKGNIRPQPQDDDQATYAPMLKKAAGLLDFTLPAQDLARQVRAYNPWPGTYMTWQGHTLKIHRAYAITSDQQANHTDLNPGSRLVHQCAPAVVTGDGIMVLDEVQPEGKKLMSGIDFLCGCRGWSK